MHTLPPQAQEAIRDDLEGTHKYASHAIPDDAGRRSSDDDAPTGRIPVAEER
jgi:phospholipid/cholesterol/gamma-HCH transport system ATP-binding protein